MSDLTPPERRRLRGGNWMMGSVILAVLAILFGVAIRMRIVSERHRDLVNQLRESGLEVATRSLIPDERWRKWSDDDLGVVLEQTTRVGVDSQSHYSGCT